VRKAQVLLTALLLVLLVASGRGCTAACEPDAYEPNDSAGAYAPLGTVEEASPEQSWTATISPSGDWDFFRVHADEGEDVCVPLTDETLRFRVRLIPPQGADCRNYDLYLYDDAGSLLGSSASGGCAEESITFTWDGVCSLSDSRYFRIEVRPSPGEYSCVPYTLYADMWEQ
jgi:hypothetical protein